MAKAKLQQIKLASSDDATQPPFPGGWVLAVFDALGSFAPAFAEEHRLLISRRTEERIKAANEVKKLSYDEIENKLVEVITALFPKVSAVNEFAKKYVAEYFRLWKQAAEFAPDWAKCLGFQTGKSPVLARALLRDLLLRLCFLESCERRLNGLKFEEAEMAFLRYDSPAQFYQTLISERARYEKLSQAKLAERLRITEKSLIRVKGGVSLPPYNLLRALEQTKACHRMLAGIGFFDRLHKSLSLHKSVLRNEFLAIASGFFRNYPAALEAFKGSIITRTDSADIRRQQCKFEGYIAYGDQLLVHPGFEALHGEMPDALWRAHLYTLQFARNFDLAQAYCQFATKATDSQLEEFFHHAGSESGGSPYRWMENLQKHK